MADYEQPAPGVVDDVFHLRWSQTPVDSRVDCADFGSSKEEVEELDAVLVEEANVVTMADSLAGQTSSYPVRTVVKFAEGNNAVVLDKSCLVGDCCSMGSEDVRKV